MTAGCVESFIFGPDRPRAEFVLGADATRPAGVRTIQLNGVRTKVASTWATVAESQGAVEVRDARLQINIDYAHWQV